MDNLNKVLNKRNLLLACSAAAVIAAGVSGAATGFVLSDTIFEGVKLIAQDAGVDVKCFPEFVKHLSNGVATAAGGSLGLAYALTTKDNMRKSSRNNILGPSI